MGYLPVFFTVASGSSDYIFTAPALRADRLVIGAAVDVIIEELTNGTSPFEFSGDAMTRQDRLTMLDEIDRLIEVLS